MPRSSGPSKPVYSVSAILQATHPLPSVVFSTKAVWRHSVNPFPNMVRRRQILNHRGTLLPADIYTIWCSSLANASAATLVKSDQSAELAYTIECFSSTSAVTIVGYVRDSPGLRLDVREFYAMLITEGWPAICTKTWADQ